MKKQKSKIKYASPLIVDSDGNVPPEFEKVLAIINPKQEARDGEQTTDNKE